MSVSIAERKPMLRNLNLPFGLLVLALGAGLLFAAELDVDPRLLGAATGSVALCGLTYRLITTWADVPVLVHVLGIAVVTFLILGAVAAYQLHGDQVPLTASTWPSVALRLAIIVVAVHWPRWVERHRSPFRK